MDWVLISCTVIVGVSLIFLWLTALAGTKFFSLDSENDNPKSIKLVIHISFLLAISAFGFILWKGYLENAMAEETIRQEKVEYLAPQTSNEEYPTRR